MGANRLESPKRNFRAAKPEVYPSGEGKTFRSIYVRRWHLVIDKNVAQKEESNPSSTPLQYLTESEVIQRSRF